MMPAFSKLAIMGNAPLFDEPLPVGQLYCPSKERFEAIFRNLFRRRYYTNHGVLAQKLEDDLARLLGVRHVVVMTNATLSLSLACKALDLPVGGKVIVPAFTFAATVQALTWAGLEPVFCDIDPETHNISVSEVERLIATPGVCAVLGVHLWGNACDVDALQRIADERGIPIFYDAAHAIGCTTQGRPVGGFGSCEIFSFHATKIMNATEGGCVATNDDALAERLRNLRSSYGRRKNVKTPIDGYGRFSEAQAAFGLLSLEEFPERCAENRDKMERYQTGLADVPGIQFRVPAEGERHNYQYVVLEIDENEFGLSRDELQRILEAENIIARRYFIPGMHQCPPYNELFPQYANALPVTDDLCQKVLQLPSGQPVNADAINAICHLVRFIHNNVLEIKGKNVA